jgi:hypothetical protein
VAIALALRLGILRARHRRRAWWDEDVRRWIGLVTGRPWRRLRRAERTENLTSSPEQPRTSYGHGVTSLSAPVVDVTFAPPGCVQRAASDTTFCRARVVSLRMTHASQWAKPGGRWGAQAKLPLSGCHSASGSQVPSHHR